MKIVFIGTVASSILGFRKDLISLLTTQGHSVYAFAIDYTREQKLELKRMGVLAMDYNLSRAGANPYTDFKNTLLLARALKSISPDIVYSYFTKPVIYGTLAAKISGVPRVIGMIEGLGYSFTEISGSNLKSKIIRRTIVLLYKLSFRYIDKLIFLNKDDPKDLQEVYKIKIKNYSILGAIGLNLDDYPYSPPPVERISFIFVGRLLEEKGIKYFLSASKKVKKIYPNVEFIVLGDFDDSNPGSLKRSDLQSYIDEKTIIYPGQVKNVAEWIKSSSVFVLPSYYREGFPRSTQEAMAIGRAVITTDNPGCRETVEEGKNGFLIKPHSSKEIEEKMIFFVNNPKAILKMGIESRRIAKTYFDNAVVNEKLMNLIFHKND